MNVRDVLLGAAGAVVLVVVGAGLVATLSLYDVAADVPDSAPIRHFIEFTRDRSIEERARHIEVPLLGKTEMIIDGASDYDAMCTGCHLAPGMEENEMRPGMNPKPPVLAKGDFGSPAEAFWVIKHGIKMTGMPAWGVTHSDQEIWNMVAFLQKLPTLSPAAYRALVAQSGGHHEHHERDDHMDMAH